jgi:acetyl-CoA carboxylase biotin carboxyl carrier protein
MDIRKVKKLIELLEESGIAEIEIKEGEESVRISRMPSGAVAMQAPMYAPSPLPIAAVAPGVSAPAAAPLPPPSVDHLVQAPMVGTF